MINLNNKKIQAILAYFFLNNRRSLYLKELSESFNIDKGNLSRYLASLVSEGVLKSEDKGKQKYFSLNREYKFLSELKKMMSADTMPELLLKKSFAKINGLDSAYIFGSYADGKFSDDSDIDVLLIGSHDHISIRREIGVLQKRLGREINAIDYTKEEYNKKVKEKGGFLARVVASPKIILK